MTETSSSKARHKLNLSVNIIGSKLFVIHSNNAALVFCRLLQIIVDDTHSETYVFLNDSILKRT